MNDKKQKVIVPQELQSDSPEKVVPLKLLTGGRGTGSDNWLADLEPETIFLTRPKSDPYGNPNRTEGLGLLQVTAYWGTSKEATRLWDCMNRQQEFWVDTRRFSNRMELFLIVGKTYNIEEKEYEQQRNRSHTESDDFSSQPDKKID